MINTFVATIDLKLADKLKHGLIDQNFEISIPPYTIFSGKKKGVSCTLYTSGKLVVQGKDYAEFVEFYLEPQILGTFILTHPVVAGSQNSRIGIDESGKGDFFGPLCIAGVYVKSDQFELMQSMGVKDSKTISDKNIRIIAAKIKSTCLYQVVRINPPKYNEIYANFLNLNKLLAWGHATTIEKLVEKSGCHEVILDQFASEWVVINALKRKSIKIDLTQRHRGEEDLTVAAASILARDAFLEGMEKLSQEIGIPLPKGGGSITIQTGKRILEAFGLEKLLSLCKHHFKNLDAILGKNRK